MKFARLTTLAVASTSALLGGLYSVHAVSLGFAQPLAGAVAAGALAAALGTVLSVLTHNRTDGSDAVADYIGKQFALAGAMFAGIAALAALNNQEAAYWWWALGIIIGVAIVLCLVLLIARLRRAKS